MVTPIYSRMESKKEDGISLDTFEIIKVQYISFNNISQVVGRGGYGKVMLVRNKRDKKFYAMKAIKKKHIIN